jgi:hypothetical protein
VTAPRDTLRRHLWVALRLCVYAMVAPPLSTHLAARTLLKLRLQQPQLRPGVVHRLAQLRDLVRHAARCRREVIARRGGLQHRDQVVDRLGVVALRDSRARGSSATCSFTSSRRLSSALARMLRSSSPIASTARCAGPRSCGTTEQDVHGANMRRPAAVTFVVRVSASMQADICR